MFSTGKSMLLKNMDGWMDGSIDQWIDGWMDSCLDGWRHVWVGEVDEWKDG